MTCDEPLDVGLEAAHCTLLDLACLVGEPLLALRLLLLTPQLTLLLELLGERLLALLRLRRVLVLERLELPSERLALLGELGLVGEEPIDKREMALDRELRRLRLRRQLGLGLCRHLARRGLVLLLGRHQLGLQHGRALAQRLQFGPHRAHLLLHTRVDGVRELRRALRLLGAVRRRDPLCISRGASAAAAGGGRCR